MSSIKETKLLHYVQNLQNMKFSLKLQQNSEDEIPPNCSFRSEQVEYCKQDGQWSARHSINNKIDGIKMSFSSRGGWTKAFVYMHYLEYLIKARAQAEQLKETWVFLNDGVIKNFERRKRSNWQKEIYGWLEPDWEALFGTDVQFSELNDQNMSTVASLWKHTKFQCEYT